MPQNTMVCEYTVHTYGAYIHKYLVRLFRFSCVFYSLWMIIYLLLPSWNFQNLGQTYFCLRIGRWPIASWWPASQLATSRFTGYAVNARALDRSCFVRGDHNLAISSNIVDSNGRYTVWVYTVYTHAFDTTTHDHLCGQLVPVWLCVCVRRVETSVENTAINHSSGTLLEIHIRQQSRTFTFVFSSLFILLFSSDAHLFSTGRFYLLERGICVYRGRAQFHFYLIQWRSFWLSLLFFVVFFRCSIKI